MSAAHHQFFRKRVAFVADADGELVARLFEAKWRTDIDRDLHPALEKDLTFLPVVKRDPDLGVARTVTHHAKRAGPHRRMQFTGFAGCGVSAGGKLRRAEVAQRLLRRLCGDERGDSAT